MPPERGPTLRTYPTPVTYGAVAQAPRDGTVKIDGVDATFHNGRVVTHGAPSRGKGQSMISI